MKKLLTVLIVALAAFTALPTLSAEKIIKIGKDAAMTLNKDNVEIVVDAKANKVVQFAAGELKTFLDSALSADIKIVNAPTAGKKHFFIGREFAKDCKFDTQKLFRDAFYIITGGDGIYIGGIDSEKAFPDKQLQYTIWSQYYERATLFGVYDFLERFANVRFYFPGELGTIVPKTDAIKVPKLEIFDFPDFDFRRYSMYQGEWMDLPKSPAAKARYEKYRNRSKYNQRRMFNGQWLKTAPNDFRNEEKNLAFYRYRMETFMEPNCHGLARYCYIKRFGKTNPEYFALMDNGQRHNSEALAHPGSICYSSNIVEEIYQDAKSFLSGEKASKRGVLTLHTGKPGWDPSACQQGHFNIMPQDSYYRCRCEKCAKKFGTGVNYATEFMWQFTVDIANRLKKEGVPGKVTQMAYRPYRSVPQTVEIPDNVSVMVAEIGPWGQYNPAGQKRDYEEIAAWSKKVAPNRVYMWNYVGKNGSSGTNLPDIPAPTHKAMALYYKSLMPLNIRGAYLESETDRYINNYLMYYLYGKLAWDNKVDTDALIEEHHKLMFGKAAQVMGTIFDDFEKLWLSRVVAKQAETARGPLISVPPESELWGEVYSAGTIENFRRRFDEAEKLTAGDRMANARVKLFRREWLEPLMNARKKYMEMSDAVSDFGFELGKPLYLGAFKFFGKYSEKSEHVDTKVTVNIGDGNLRIVFECDEPDFDNINATKRQFNDPNVWQDSSVEVFINPNGDNKNFYQIILNTQNSKTINYSRLEGNIAKHTGTIKAGVYSSVTRSKKGYRAALSIPLKQLKGFDVNKAKFNFTRNRQLKVNKDYVSLYIWSPFAKRFNDVENFGRIIKKSDSASFVDNGDFAAPKRDRWLGKWFHGAKLPAGQIIERDTREFVSYPASMKMVNPTDDKMLYFCQYLPRLKPDSEYEISCLVKYKNVKRSPRSSGGGVLVNINVEKNAWFPKGGLCGSSNWTRLKYRVKTTGKTNNPHRAYMRFYLNSASGTVWIDDVKITEIKK
ncbi:MAG: DUF4838 domain-containing protein [Lentisphaeria bacterium]|nr:DUF4838 domain-containing protein [Lentisphaeria bacterium]